MRILVTGASGNVGAELAHVLADAGHQVSAVTRAPARASLPAGVDAVTADLNEPASLRPAWVGVDGLFLLPGYPGTPDLLADAARAGVTQVVLLSGSSAGAPASANAVTRYMSQTEEAVRAAGLPFAILRPSGFMSNTLQWADQLKVGDVVEGPFADVPIAMIDPRDIARAAAAILTGGQHDEHNGRVYRLSGPAALLPADRVRILADVLRRPLSFEPQSNEAAYAQMSSQMPTEYVEAFFDFYVRGTLDDSIVYPTVAELTGRPPGTFRRWAEDHALAFAPARPSGLPGDPRAGVTCAPGEPGAGRAGWDEARTRRTVPAPPASRPRGTRPGRRRRAPRRPRDRGKRGDRDRR